MKNGNFTSKLKINPISLVMLLAILTLSVGCSSLKKATGAKGDPSERYYPAFDRQFRN